EPGALRLGRGADPHDQCRVPPRRQRRIRGRGTEAGLRSARRPVEQWPLCALTGGGDRRRDRTAYDRDRLPVAGGGVGDEDADECRGDGGRSTMPALQPAGTGAGGGVPELRALRLVEVRVEYVTPA